MLARPLIGSERNEEDSIDYPYISHAEIAREMYGKSMLLLKYVRASVMSLSQQ